MAQRAQYQFVTDGMLNGLLKWMRILGFDTRPVHEFKTGEKVQLNSLAAYFLTTSEKNWQAWPGNRKILLKSEFPSEQLKELDTQLQILKHVRFLSRCLVCNTLLQRISPEEAAGQVPQKVAERFQEFRKCNQCGRIYWEGGHVLRMKDKLRRMGIPISKL